MNFLQKPAAWLTILLLSTWALILVSWVIFVAKPQTSPSVPDTGARKVDRSGIAKDLAAKLGVLGD